MESRLIRIILTGILFSASAYGAGTGPEDESLQLTFTGHKSPVYCLAVSPDGKQVASGGEDQLIHIWDLHTGEIQKTLTGHNQPVKYINWSPDGKKLLTAAGAQVFKWNLEDGKFKNHNNHVTHVYNLVFSKDATSYYSTSLKTKFNLWDAETGNNIHAFEGHSKSTLAVDLSEDNKLIASGSLDQSIKIWDADSREVIHTISAHGGNIYSLDFSRDGKLLASASKDGTVKTWNTETGKIHKLFTGHEYAVVYVRFSPDARYLVTASYDRTAKIWEVSTGDCIYTFIDHKDAVYAADFTPDGKNILTCSNDGSVMVWEFSPRFFAEHYYFDELNREMDESGLFLPRDKGEKKTDFDARQLKADSLRRELHEKYYRLYLEKNQ